MREIGQINNQADARRFSDYLYSLGVENEAELNRHGNWTIWVSSEEHLEQAEAELEGFQADPQAEKYQSGAKEGRVRFAEEAKRMARSRDQVIDVRTQVFHNGVSRMQPLTAALIALSVLATASMWLSLGFDARQLFSISNWQAPHAPGAFLPEVAHGQIWRLVTPIFLHFGPLHILFNMMWLASLGSEIEQKQGRWEYLAQVLVFAIVGNLAQYLLSGPNFGGMSGVVYGLFSYVWIRQKLEPSSGYYIDQTTVTMMVAWYFLCLLGILPIANAAHTAGLLGGIVWAWASVQARRYFRR